MAVLCFLLGQCTHQSYGEAVGAVVLADESSKPVNLTCDVEVDTVQTMEVLDLIWLGPYFI